MRATERSMGTIPPSLPADMDRVVRCGEHEQWTSRVRDRMELRTPCLRQGQSDQRQGQPALSSSLTRRDREPQQGVTGDLVRLGGRWINAGCWAQHDAPPIPALHCRPGGVEPPPSGSPAKTPSAMEANGWAGAH